MAERAQQQEARASRPFIPDIDTMTHINGTSSELPEDLTRLVDDLSKVLTEPDIGAWMTTPCISLLSVFRLHPQYWGLSKATYKKWGGNTFDLEKAVDHYRTLHDLDEVLTPPESTVDPFVFTDGRSILATPIVPRRWLLPGIIADGLTILGGSPKGGKTYLAYALALAVAKYGTWCQHWKLEQGKVIYITLEDDANDTHLRLLELDPTLQLDANRLLFVHGQDTIPSFGSGLREWLEETLQFHKPRLLIIDPISYLYVLKKSGAQFEETKDMLFPLQWLGKMYQCAIVCLDHRRKRSREDVSMVDTLYGSVAKQAVPSGIIMVNRDQDDIELDMTIRNGQQQKEYVSFTFDNGRCFLAYKGGESAPMNQSDLRMRLLDVLQASPIPLGIPDLLVALALPDSRQERANLWQILYRCMKAREIEKTSRGRYVSSTDDTDEHRQR